MSIVACVDQLLFRGLDDWVHAPEVAYVASTIGGAATEAEVQRLSLDMIRDVVQTGLMKAGDVANDGFHDWDLSPDEAMNRIEHDWASLGRGPKLGEICWLSNTEEGDKRARRLADSVI